MSIIIIIIIIIIIVAVVVVVVNQRIDVIQNSIIQDCLFYLTLQVCKRWLWTW